MRFLSSGGNHNGLHEFQLEMINHYVNRNFWDLSKYPDLIHLLFCLCATGSKQFHKWIPNKRESKPKWVELVKLSSPSINEDEINILKTTMNYDKVYELAYNLGKSEKEAKDYAKSFKE